MTFNNSYTYSRLKVINDPPKGKLGGTSDLFTLYIYRGLKGHISKDKVLIIDLYNPCLPIDNIYLNNYNQIFKSKRSYSNEFAIMFIARKPKDLAIQIIIEVGYFLTEVV